MTFPARAAFASLMSRSFSTFMARAFAALVPRARLAVAVRTRPRRMSSRVFLRLLLCLRLRFVLGRRLAVLRCLLLASQCADCLFDARLETMQQGWLGGLLR